VMRSLQRQHRIYSSRTTVSISA